MRKVTYRFVCRSEPPIAFDHLLLGPFAMTLLAKADGTSEQALLVSFDEEDDSPDTLAFAVHLFGEPRQVRGQMTLPRITEVKEVVSALQGLLVLHVDLEVRFNQFKVSAGELELSVGPAATPQIASDIPSHFISTMANIAPKLVKDEIALTFWRLGYRAVKEDRPLEAFYNFWYFIERKFGDGKWRENELVMTLMSSNMLRYAIQLARERIDQQSISLLSKEQRQVFLGQNDEITIRHLVRRRGDLHHAKPSSDWHPGNPDPVRADAAFLGSLCQMCVALMASAGQEETPSV